jgi:signal transduction histidine kinase
MKPQPFRRRLTLWSMVVVTVSLLVCGLSAAFFVHRRAVAEMEDRLEAETEHFFAELARHGAAKFDWRKIGHEMGEWLPETKLARFVEIRAGSETPRYRSPNLPPPGFAGQPPGIRDARVGDQVVRLLVTARDGVTFALALPRGEALGIARDLLLSLLVGLPFALAFAWFGGRWLAARAVEPVIGITSVAERLTAEQFDQRVPVPVVNDEIKRLAVVLNSTFDRLERSYQQALRFSADASHELKTPLTNLRASIEALLESPALTEADRAAISGLLEQTRRLSSITSSLLLLARADSGRLTLEAQPHDLAELTLACVEDARIIAENTGIAVDCELPPSAVARVDRIRFAQIVSNLLDNAVKYNRPGGSARVTLTDRGNQWELRIGNTGPAIVPEHRARLFERFFRAEHSQDEMGYGLGLSLARELARAHGGDVVLARSDGQWTEFVVTFPKQGRPVSAELAASRR